MKKLIALVILAAFVSTAAIGCASAPSPAKQGSNKERCMGNEC